LDKLRQACLEEAKALVDKKDYSKASSYYYKPLVKLDPDNFELFFVKGVCDALMRNGSEAYKSLNDAMPELKKSAEAGTYKAPKLIEKSLSDAFINYSTLLKDQSYADSAKSIIMFGKILLPMIKQWMNNTRSSPTKKKKPQLIEGLFLVRYSSTPLGER
jgi:tetratricopeptide (TPR) repeat protein